MQVAAHLFYLVPLTDRLNYCSSIMNNVGYAHAVEKLLGIQIPKRAEQLRVLVSELARLADHIICLGINAVDIGAFTADVANLSRIVTLHNLNIVPARDGTLAMDATARTYRYLDAAEVAEQRKSQQAAAKPGAK